ncbi:DUF3592 domain-containing protein [Brachybacterium timonense]|uniref:DUF3592 domain-containing protein n=1 Tax=Brachybacterium timonense TaxID=2050896 RepID=UPI000D0B1865|nr:DUF3592 domain-containing protein [Brachybacterium timonense]
MQLMPAVVLAVMTLIVLAPGMIGLLAAIRHGRRLWRVIRLRRSGLRLRGVVLQSRARRITNTHEDLTQTDLTWRDELIRVAHPAGVTDGRPVVPGADSEDRTGQEVDVLADPHNPRVFIAPGVAQRHAVGRQVIWMLLGLVGFASSLGVASWFVGGILEVLPR